MRRCGKLSILSECAARVRQGLIYELRSGARRTLWHVVAFVDQRSSRVFQPIGIRRIGTHRHQDHRMVAAESEVHALLKTGVLTLAHLDVGNDVVAHDAFLDAERIEKRHPLARPLKRRGYAQYGRELIGCGFRVGVPTQTHPQQGYPRATALACPRGFVWREPECKRCEAGT